MATKHLRKKEEKAFKESTRRHAATVRYRDKVQMQFPDAFERNYLMTREPVPPDYTKLPPFKADLLKQMTIYEQASHDNVARLHTARFNDTMKSRLLSQQITLEELTNDEGYPWTDFHEQVGEDLVKFRNRTDRLVSKIKARKIRDTIREVLSEHTNFDRRDVTFKGIVANINDYLQPDAV